MVGSRQVPLQQQINSDEKWERMLQNEGLTVVDIYSEWCGPCTAMTSNLKRIKRELAGHNLNLAVAESDKISYLKHFRNKSEPTWMFLIEGKVVNIMYGANAPKLMRLITEELKEEAAVKSGMREGVQLDIVDLSREEESISIKAVDEIPTSEEIKNIATGDEEFDYRPF